MEPDRPSPPCGLSAEALARIEAAGSHRTIMLREVLRTDDGHDERVLSQIITFSGLMSRCTKPLTASDGIWVNREDFPRLGKALADTDVSARAKAPTINPSSSSACRRTAP